MSRKADSSPRTLHDRLFKEFLHRFLPNFLQTFFPQEAARLNFATLQFLDKELVVNLPEQELRITDVVAEVQTWQGEPETIIVHVEVEGRNKRTLPQRMSEYYALLRILRRKAVLPIALVLLPRAGGLKWQTYSEKLFGREVLRFRYGQVGIREIPTESYVQSTDAVTAALAVLMKPIDLSPGVVKLLALQQVIASQLTEGDKLFLVEFINTYSPTEVLQAEEEKIMQRLTEIEMTWGEKLREEGREEGREKGREEGKIEGERQMLLRLLTLMFGPLPEAFVARIKRIQDEEALTALGKQMLTAKTLAEIVLPPEPEEKRSEASV